MVSFPMSDDQRPVWDGDFWDGDFWDGDFARKMLGKTMLVGMTYADPQGDRVEQFYGQIVSVDPKQGVCMQLAGSRSGEVFRLPPDVRNVWPATPGSYKLRSTGEIVENPDYTATWTINPRNA